MSSGLSCPVQQLIYASCSCAILYSLPSTQLGLWPIGFFLQLTPSAITTFTRAVIVFSRLVNMLLVMMVVNDGSDVDYCDVEMRVEDVDEVVMVLVLLLPINVVVYSDVLIFR